MSCMLNAFYILGNAIILFGILLLLCLIIRLRYPACCMVPALLAAAFGNLREEQANAIEDTKEVSKRRRAGSRKKHRIARTLPEDKRQRVKV